ncbi:MAG TPA: hypothetical protein VFQ61_13755 [Polyangiaceae bacterium]|nr:hypothetical protein [Polyangiaceae bacterium]
MSTPSLRLEDSIDFGALPEPINELLQRGVLAYRLSPEAAEEHFQRALALAPSALPVYFCLYKIHTYGNRLDAALSAAGAGLAEAARQAGWPADFEAWPTNALAEPNESARFALYTLKALAFIRLKREEVGEAARIIARLRALDPQGYVGWPVVAELLNASQRGLASS